MSKVDEDQQTNDGGEIEHVLRRLFNESSKFKVENNPYSSINEHSDTRAWYNCIQNNDVELLEKLIHEYDFQDNQDDEVKKETVGCILAKTYEKLSIIDSQPSTRVEFLLISKIIDSRFLSVKGKQVDDKVNIQDVKERISVLVELINFLSLTPSETIPYKTVVLVGKLITFNLHSMKNIMKTTYDLLPWNEMEFCLTMFLSSFMKTIDDEAAYSLVLDRRELLMHLKEFADILDKVKTSLSCKSLNRQLRMGGYVKTMEKIIITNPEFQSLFHNYQIIRDVYSLKYIDSYIDIATSVNIGDGMSKLVIERTLQVIGEYFKSTPQSPNMSESVNEMLIHSAPKNLKDIITGLRDSLSHVHTLESKLHIESNWDDEMFLQIQNDLKKIHYEINHVLNIRRQNALLVFIERILKCQNLDVIWEMCFTATKVDMDALKNKALDNTDINELKTLVGKLENAIPHKSEREMKLFDDIYRSIVWFQNKTEISQTTYSEKLDLLKESILFATSSDNIDLIHTKFRHVYKQMQYEEDDTEFERILHSVFRIYRHLGNNKNDIYVLVFDIFNFVLFRFRKIENIIKFKFTLQNRNESMQNPANQYEEVDDILSCLEGFLTNVDSKNKFAEFCSQKRNIHQTKEKLIDLLENKIQSKTEQADASRFPELVKQLKMKRKSEDAILKKFEAEKFVDCKNELSKLDDIYGVLVNSIKRNIKELNIFTFQKVETALKNFIKSLINNQEIAEALKKLCNHNRGKIEMYYEQRLHLLKELLCKEGHSNFDIFELYYGNKNLQVVVELILFDLLEILENMSKLSSEKLFLDVYTPVLIGKTLRNYLAHGNALVDLFGYSSMCILYNALKFMNIGSGLIDSDDVLIGQTRQLMSDRSRSRYVSHLYRVYLQNTLAVAIEFDNMQLLEECIEKGADIRGRYKNGWTTLHLAAAHDSLNVFEYLKNHDVSTSMKDLSGREPFEVAVLHGSQKILMNLIGENSLDTTSFSKIQDLFTLVICSGCIQTLIFFLENIPLQDEYNLLHMAAFYNQQEILKILLNRNFDVNKKGASDSTALHVAARKGNSEIIGILLSHGADVNAVNESGLTPLHSACEHNHSQIVDILLKNDDHKPEKLVESTTALYLAAQFGQTDVLKMLLLHYQKVYSHTDLQFILDKEAITNLTLMHLACKNGYVDTVKLLVKFGASVNSTNNRGITPLHYAASNGCMDIVNILLDEGANVNVITQNGVTPLYEATRKGHLQVVSRLLEEGSDVNCSTDEKFTPLHSAAELGNEELINVLLDNGASLDVTSSEGSPLHVAATFGHVNAVRAILAKQTDVDIRDELRCTPLHRASSFNNADVASELIQRNADPDALNECGFTPLHLAASKGNTNAVRILLEADASVDCRNEHGTTPLQLAVLQGHYDVVVLLLNHGADVNGASETGITPLHAAALQDNMDIVQILIDRGAQVDTITTDTLL